MSIKMKQARPGHCYCRIQGDKDLNDIAEIITVLNYKILRLRNEVIALKNGNLVEEKLFENSGDDRKYLCLRCCEKKFGISHSPQNFKKSIIPEIPKDLAHLFVNNLNTAEKHIPTNVSNVINFSLNEKLEKNSKPILKKVLKRKKISRGVQCNSAMERKKKHFLNCLKKKSNVKEELYWEPNRKRRVSPTNNFCQGFVHVMNDPNCVNVKRPRGEQLCKFCETYVHNEKFQEMKISKNELDVHKMVEQMNERQPFELPTNRMVGGAEFRGNRLIADFSDKIRKMNLYKNIKFNVTNVKKRLDACIIELNEIIEDISLILPNTDICKEQQNSNTPEKSFQNLRKKICTSTPASIKILF